MSWKDTVNYTHIMRMCRGGSYEGGKTCNVLLLHKICIVFTHLEAKIYNKLPYSRVIRRMRLYLHRKRICAYKRAAPNKEQRLNSSTCDVYAYI